MTIPTNVAGWDAYPRDLTINDRSRMRGEAPAAARAAAERTTDLGNGLTSTTYVDYLTPHNPPQS
jgi:hypothetical protein